MVQQIEKVISDAWQTFVATPWRQCSAQRTCSWWCLCCEKWLCWISLILVAILVIVFAILYTLVAVLTLIACETTCVVLFILQAILGIFYKSVRDNMIRCFQTSDVTPPATPGGPPGQNQSGLGLNPNPNPPGSDTTITPMTVTVATVADLVEATRWRRLLASSNSLRLEPSSLGDEQSRRLQLELDRLVPTCGCREGRIGLGVAAVLVALLLSSWASGLSLASAVGLASGVLIAGAVLGKLAGVYLTHVHLRRSIRALPASVRT